MRKENTALKQQIAADIYSKFGSTVSRAQLLSVSDNYPAGLQFLQKIKSGRGLYDISSYLSGVNQDSVVSSMISKAQEKTDEEILAEQRRRFHTLHRMGDGVTKGQIQSMIVSGPAGTGKTYTIEGLLESAANAGSITYESVHGFVRPSGLFRMLWENREENQVILLDDADSVFADEVALNLLKAALDTTKRRIISWRSEKKFETTDGDIIPNSFEYKGSIIFITNLNFDSMLNSKLGPHFSALISRSYYIDLNMANNRECMLRIKDVLANSDMAVNIGLTENQTKDLLSFVESNYDKLRELSLRIVLKLGKIMTFASDFEDFKNVAMTTCFKS